MVTDLGREWLISGGIFVVTPKLREKGFPAGT